MSAGDDVLPDWAADVEDQSQQQPQQTQQQPPNWNENAQSTGGADADADGELASWSRIVGCRSIAVQRNGNDGSKQYLIHS